MQTDKFIKQLDNGSILLTAPVMIPGALDCDAPKGEPALTREQVRAFKESYDKYKFLDKNHTLTRDKKKVGECEDSFISDKEITTITYDGETKKYPEGTWFLTSRITDEATIAEAKNGRFTGYSPTILTKTSADEYYEALKQQLNSAGNALIKDISDPVVLSVSLVEAPCQHESKICKIQKTEVQIMEQEELSLKSKILQAMGMSEEAEVVALKSEVSTLKAEIADMKESFAESLKSMQDEFKQTLTEALTPVEEVEVVAEKAEEVEATEEAEVEVEEEEEGVEEEVEEEIVEKGESKAAPVHDNLQAEKAKPRSIYEVLNRNPDGRRRL